MSEDTSDYTDGVAGASARRQYERRSARDEARTREAWGRFGGIAVALTPERQSTRAWATGSEGELRVGAMLDGLASEAVRVLHDRRIPGTRANIDHLVVTPGGVWVVDAKKYAGRPELRVEGGLFRPRVERLFVRNRDQTRLVDGMLTQLDVVRPLVEAPIIGALCFVEADWPLIGGDFTIRGVHALWPKRLRTLLSRSSGEVDVVATAAALGRALPRA
jgi:hypothetical protein